MYKKSFSLLKGALFFVFLLVTGFRALSQQTADGIGLVSGSVTADGNRIAGAIVELHLLGDRSVVTTTMTDSLGIFLFDHLIDYKGRVLVLNFWATWCGYCKKDLVVLKQAVDHYANDESVTFLFVDTREIKPDYKVIAQRFMEKNNYPFKVVFDELAKDTIIDKYYKAFNAPFLPVSMIVDRNGHLQYEVDGYWDEVPNEKQVARIIDLIDKVKKLN